MASPRNDLPEAHVARLEGARVAQLTGAGVSALSLSSLLAYAVLMAASGFQAPLASIYILALFLPGVVGGVAVLVALAAGLPRLHAVAQAAAGLIACAALQAWLMLRVADPGSVTWAEGGLMVTPSSLVMLCAAGWFLWLTRARTT